jgi:hypothetical protein
MISDEQFAEYEKSLNAVNELIQKRKRMRAQLEIELISIACKLEDVTQMLYTCENLDKPQFLLNEILSEFTR